MEVDVGAFTDCEAIFTKDQEYLVYAERNRAGQVVTSRCKGSQPTRLATADLNFLNAYKSHQTQATISGTLFPIVGQGDNDDSRLRRRLQGTQVSALRLDGVIFETAASDTLEFLLSPVRAGSYKITTKQSGLRSDSPEYQLDVPPGGCAVLSIGMGFDGKVTGTLRESNLGPARSVELSLLPVLKGDLVAIPIKTKTGPDGHFQIVGVPSGLYRLGVNMEQEPSADLPFKRTFYPGTQYESHARIIHVHDGESVKLGTLRLPKRMTPRKIHVQALWPDGTPAPFAHVWCSAEGYAPWQHLLTDKAGTFTFDALDGNAYILGAATASNYEIEGRRNFLAQWVRVAPGSDVVVKLHLEPTKGKAK